MRTSGFVIHVVSLFFVGGMVSFSSCLPPCSPTSEPQAQTYFRTNKGYTSISTISPRVTIKPGFNSTVESLPISLSQDQLSFVFANSRQSDTLSISYKRNFKFESERCGYVVIIEDFKVISPTSFKDVRVEVSSGSYSYSNSNQFSIYVND